MIEPPIGFNPLTGISSILTGSIAGVLIGAGFKFQSPDGDFVYSDGAGISLVGPDWALVSIP